MDGLFDGASSFNEDIGANASDDDALYVPSTTTSVRWDTPRYDDDWMFNWADAFNQDIGDWTWT